MAQNPLALVGLVAVVRCAYKHYKRYIPIQVRIWGAGVGIRVMYSKLVKPMNKHSLSGGNHR